MAGIETVWLTQKEMSKLFGVSTDNVGLHFSNILKEKELDISTTEDSSVIQREGDRNIKRKLKIQFGHDNFSWLSCLDVWLIMF